MSNGPHKFAVHSCRLPQIIRLESLKDGVRHYTVAAVAAAQSKQRKKSVCHRVTRSVYSSESSATLSCCAAAVRYHKVRRARYEHESTQERALEHSPTLEHSITSTSTRALEHTPTLEQFEHEHDHSSTPAHTNTRALENEHRSTSTRRTRARAQALGHVHEVARQSVLDVSNTSCETRRTLFSPRT